MEEIQPEIWRENQLRLESWKPSHDLKRRVENHHPKGPGGGCYALGFRSQVTEAYWGQGLSGFVTRSPSERLSCEIWKMSGWDVDLESFQNKDVHI